MIIENILQQHADDCAALADARKALTHSAYANLPRLDGADKRLRASLDGLRLAGEHATAFYTAMRERPSVGRLFTSTVRALEQRDDRVLDELISLSRALPETVDGVLCAFGWVDRSNLRGTVARLLTTVDPFNRLIGIACCAVHRVNPGLVEGHCLGDADPAVRARAFRTVGELGLTALLPECGTVLRTQDDDNVRFWTAWSAVMLGNRSRSLDTLTEHAFTPGAHRARALRLAMQAMSTTQGQAVLRQFAQNPSDARWLIHACGIIGDPAYAPLLVKQMEDLNNARLAGEAFTTITGAALGLQALDRPAPEDFQSGPTDDPDDPNVDMDPDHGLPWPDPEKVEAWWAANAHRFQKGQRYFMGKPVTREHCIDILKNGYQRQRILAAQYLCLLDPGTPLFNTSAPAWRQQKLLAQLV